MITQHGGGEASADRTLLNIHPLLSLEGDTGRGGIVMITLIMGTAVVAVEDIRM